MGSLVEITRFFDPEEAYCAQGYLRSCGFYTFLQNEHHLATAPHLRVALNGYGLFVHKKQVVEARDALADIIAESATGPVAVKAEENVRASRKNWFWLPTFLFFGAWPFVPRIKSTSDVILQGFVLGVLYFFSYVIFIHPLLP